MRELPNNGFIILGAHNRVDGSGFIRANLNKVNNTGNLIWSRYYGIGNYHLIAFDVTTTSDGGFAIGCILDPSNTTLQDVDPVIIKTDSNGNQQWLKHLGNPFCEEESAMVDKAFDGNIQVGCTYSDSCVGFGDYFDRINFIKLRNNSEVIWDTKYGLSKHWLWLNKIRVLTNGDIVATGQYDYWAGPEKEVSWILKTDSAGNELWYREYTLLNAQYSWNVLNDVIQTNDNGFAACGFVTPAPPDTGTSDSWVLKVDSLGCQGVNDCWVGTNEIIVKTFTPDKPYVIYPNPATDKIAIEFHENSKGAEIEIFDQFGRSQYKSKLSPNKDQVDVDISKWKPGLYVIKVILDERILGTDKILKF
jgi:hypothetical protein